MECSIINAEVEHQLCVKAYNDSSYQIVIQKFSSIHFNNKLIIHYCENHAVNTRNPIQYNDAVLPVKEIPLWG